LLRQTASEKAKLHGLDLIKSDPKLIILSTLYESYLPFSNTLDDRQSLYYVYTVTSLLIDLFESIDKSWDVAESGNVPIDYN
jgi:hypothetical protein